MRWPFTSPCRPIFSAWGDTKADAVVVDIRIEARNVGAVVVGCWWTGKYVKSRSGEAGLAYV
jgi:hypothetical protein